MKELLKNLGLLLIVGGVILLGIGFFTHSLSNLLLGYVLALVVGGLVAYIAINKKLM